MNELENLLSDRWPDLLPEARGQVLRFYELLIAENAIQNLTRLSSPLDFFEGHAEDVRQLLKAQVMTFPALDLGSGGGVPGLLGACIEPSPWILCDSEGSKARFLQSAVDNLGLKQVFVVSGRAEEYLRDHAVPTIVARAVGPVERIFAWIESCSTWNKLVLLKGPGWDDEWASFGLSRHRKKLRIESVHEYTVGALNKQRKIVTLSRTP